MKSEAKCFYCGSPAPLLCDGYLGSLAAPDGKTADSKKQFTCDRPLCLEHVKERIRFHVSCRPRSKSHWDSYDYCDDCVKEERRFGDARIHKGMQKGTILLPMEEGLAMQRRRLFKVGEQPTDPDSAGLQMDMLQALKSLGL